MCQRVDCSECGRPTYAGCGRHVEAVLGDVPPAERCRCRERGSKAGAARGAAEKSWFSGLFAGARGRP
jgi:hypothetical protein